MLKLPLFSVLDVDYSTKEVVNASKPTPSTLSSKIVQNYSLKLDCGLASTQIKNTHTCIPFCTDLQLLESTVYSLEESILHIQQIQSKILDNQDQIFQRLHDLEKCTSVPFVSRVQSANTRAGLVYGCITILPHTQTVGGGSRTGETDQRLLF